MCRLPADSFEHIIIINPYSFPISSVLSSQKEKDAKALDKKKEWSSAAHTEKEHGPYYEAKHSAAGQVHGAYYADKHKSAKQLTEEKGERQEQWIKDKVSERNPNIFYFLTIFLTWK